MSTTKANRRAFLFGGLRDTTSAAVADSAAHEEAARHPQSSLRYEHLYPQSVPPTEQPGRPSDGPARVPGIDYLNEELVITQGDPS